MSNSGWFVAPGSGPDDGDFLGSNDQTRPLRDTPPTIEEDAAAAEAAIDRIQGAYEQGANRIQDEFSQYADEAQGKIRPPEWPTE